MPIKKVEVSITTTSEARPAQGGGPPITTPKITMNGNPLPTPTSPAYLGAGWQLVVLDAHKDMTKPESILFNKYLLGPQPGRYDTHMYTELVRRILVSGDVNAQIVFAVSYGLDANMTPTNEAIQTLFELGSGAKLQSWVAGATPGKQPDDPKIYVALPASYALIGYSSYKFGQGYEVFERPGGDAPAPAQLTATLSNIVPG